VQSIQANRGRALEDLLETVFESAGPGVKIFRQNNKWVPLRSGRSFPYKGVPVDFVGVVSGIPVAVECKETAGKSLPLNPSRFPEKEILALREFSEAGGRAFVVAAFWRVDSLAVYRFESFHRFWQQYKTGGRASLRPDDADAWAPLADAAAIPNLFSEVCSIAGNRN